MHTAIKIVRDSQRGCGWRHKKGAMYFFSDNPGVPCGVLPLELKPCPTCAAMGLKCRTAPTRGFTWVDPSRLFDWTQVRCQNNNKTQIVTMEYAQDRSRQGVCPDCSMYSISHLEKCGLLWVGERHYATPDDFDKESQRLGISRRLPHDHLPVGFRIGQDFIMLAHKKAVLRLGEAGEGAMFDYFPGVFRIFRPDRVEVLCDGTETDDVIEGYLKRGLTPVKVERNG